MSRRDIARRAAVEVSFAGVDITRSIRPYLLSLTYTDNEEDETDDLQIKLQDREAIWTESWLDELIKATAASRMKIEAVIATRNWNGDGGDVVLPCGLFELDSVTAEGPPNTVTIKATALPFSAAIRQTKKNRVWEAYYLSGIANQMCSEAGMTCMYLSADDPYFEREEQVKTSDIAFLSELCHDSGISLKVTNNIVVLFDQRDYESRQEVMTITRGDGSYTRHSIGTSAAETQYASCRVSYVDPRNGQCIEGVAKTEDYNDDATDNQQLEISARVAGVAEAEQLAEKLLRLHNKFSRTCSFTLPGSPGLVAGVTVRLARWGDWSGKYIIKQATHSVSGSGGYTTQINLRRVLEGY